MFWADDSMKLSNNHFSAHSQLKSSWHSSAKDQERDIKHGEFTVKEMSKGYIIAIEQNENYITSPTEHYLSHQPVINLNRPRKSPGSTQERGQA